MNDHLTKTLAQDLRAIANEHSLELSEAARQSLDAAAEILDAAQQASQPMAAPEAAGEQALPPLPEPYTKAGKELAPTFQPLFSREQMHAYARAAQAAQPPLAPAEGAGIQVSVGRMSESNGRVTWMVMLHRQGAQTLLNGHQVYSSHIEGRAQYEAAALRHFLGQGPEPDILDYDTDGAAQPKVPQPLPVRDETEFCWLVELFDPITDYSLGRYHTGFTDIGHASRTTQDPLQAKRYGSKEAAERAVAGLFSKVGIWRAVEHGFMARAALTQPAPEAAKGVPADEGPKCRDCADFGPICPNSGLPCGEATPPAPEAQQASDFEKFLALAEAAGIKSIHDLPGLIPALQATETQQPAQGVATRQAAPSAGKENSNA